MYDSIISKVYKSKISEMKKDSKIRFGKFLRALLQKEVSVMSKEATLQVRMDSELKEQVKLLYKLGIANGKYRIPDDIDGSNDEIAEMFGVK